MAKFLLNEGYSEERQVIAARFITNGDFVDFLDAGDSIVFRVKAASVQTVERSED